MWFVMGMVLWVTNVSVLAWITILLIGSGVANVVVKYITEKITSFICSNESEPETYRFKDKQDDVFLEYHKKVPGKSIVIRISATDGHEAECYRINPTLLESYLIYRREFVLSYGTKPDLAKDIKYPKPLRVPELKGQETYETFATRLNTPERGLDEYSIAIALDSMKRWNDSAKQYMQSFIAYETESGIKTEIGFVLFQEKTINGRPVVYIAEAAVSRRGDSIGRRLMECVLAHYSHGTEFHILARNFNTDAINLYEKRLGFEPLTRSEVIKLNYNPDRYMGFKHISNERELEKIKSKRESNNVILGALKIC